MYTPRSHLALFSLLEAYTAHTYLEIYSHLQDVYMLIIVNPSIFVDNARPVLLSRSCILFLPVSFLSRGIVSPSPFFVPSSSRLSRQSRRYYKTRHNLTVPAIGDNSAPPCAAMQISLCAATPRSVLFVIRLKISRVGSTATLLYILHIFLSAPRTSSCSPPLIVFRPIVSAHFRRATHAL